MPSGKIKRLMKDRGFGFIRGGDGQEVFFHRSSLDGITFESLAEGQEVEFEIEQSPNLPPNPVTTFDQPDTLAAVISDFAARALAKKK